MGDYAIGGDELDRLVTELADLRKWKADYWPAMDIMATQVHEVDAVTARLDAATAMLGQVLQLHCPDPDPFYADNCNECGWQVPCKTAVMVAAFLGDDGGKEGGDEAPA